MGSKNRNQGVRLAPWMFLTCWAVSLAQDHSFSSASLSTLSVQNLPWRTLSSYLEKLVTCNGHVRVLLKRTPMESGIKTPQSPATEISLAEARKTREPRPFRCHTMWNVHTGKRDHFSTVNGTYPTCQNNREPSDPPLANSPSWTGCQATAAKPNNRERGHDYRVRRLQGRVTKWEARRRHTPVASFLWPRKTWSSSFRFRISKSLQRWSRDAVRSQLPLRFNFTSITVFLWAWLETKHRESTACQDAEQASLNGDGPFGWKHVDEDGERCGLVVIKHVTITR